MSVELAPEEYRKPLTYEEAIMFCFALDIDGVTGWRMPTLDEMAWAFDSNILERPLGYGVIPLYWTSTTLKDKPVGVTKLYGKIISHDGYHAEELWVVPVRDN